MVVLTNLGELPFYRSRFPVRIVVSHSYGSQIGKQGEEDDEVDADGFVENDHGEDLTGSLDSQYDCAQTRCEEDNISSRLRSLRRTFDSNTTISLLQRGSIVDTVTSHGSEMASLLKHLNDSVLVLGKDFGKTISAFDKVVLHTSSQATMDETIRVVDLGAQRQHLAGFLGNGDGISCKHLDGNTEMSSLDDSLSGILTGRVEHGKQSQKNPVAVILLVSNTKRAETATSKVLGLLSVEFAEMFRSGSEKLQNSLGSTLCTDVFVLTEAAYGGDSLGDGVERRE
ncbi:hypothetical protein HG531_005543 [Fusarium graminearum]|nr:hypothetical protein HG531_005543 [Fusarium graminearum]